MDQNTERVANYLETRAATMMAMLGSLSKDGHSDECRKVCKSVIAEMERVRSTLPAPEVQTVIDALLVNLHDFLDTHTLPKPTHIVSQRLN